MRETKRCVRCLTNPATIYAGYVTRLRSAFHPKEEILAGWCIPCVPTGRILAAWRGHWRRRMGVRLGTGSAGLIREMGEPSGCPPSNR